MKYILAPLLIMLTLTIFGNLYKSSTVINYSSFNNSDINIDTYNGTSIVNGSETTISLSLGLFTFSISQTQGIITLLIGVCITIALIGINILDIGLRDYSLKIINNCLFFYGIWCVFATAGYDWIVIVPVGGWIMFIIMTIVYTLGVYKQINSGGGAQ